MCHPTSPCHTTSYVPGKVKLTDSVTIQKLESTLKSTYIYRNAESFCRVCQMIYIIILKCYDVILQCRDTYWIESFNHQLLTYLQKRVHFSTNTFNMRMNIALMDWVGLCYALMYYQYVHIHV